MENRTNGRLSKEEVKALESYLLDVKKQLKSYSKNELIRMVGALLVDNAALKSMIDSQSKPAKEAP